MAQVLIRNLDDAAVERFRLRARLNNRSLEAELREALTEVISRDKQEALAKLDAIRARSKPWQPGQQTGTEMIREDRDSR